MIGLVLLDVGEVRSHYPDGLEQLDVVDEADELVIAPEWALPNEDFAFYIFSKLKTIP